MVTRIYERQLVRRALEVIEEYGQQNTGLPTDELNQRLRERLRPSDADLVILKDRNDDRLSQVIRNLVSHRTLERFGLATYLPSDDRSQSGSYVLTDLGHDLANNNDPQGDLF